jgi:hypothetical protein
MPTRQLSAQSHWCNYEHKARALVIAADDLMPPVDVVEFRFNV